MLFFLLASMSSASAQNLIVNGDFESYNVYGQITAPSYTDYVRVNGNYVVEAGHYVINSTTSGHGGGQGWPMPSDSHGKFMIVNGFGGNSNPTKVVWRQTIAVTTQTNYTFSYRYVNLNRVIYGQINPSKLQVKINGVNFGGENSLPTNNNWHNWNNNGVAWNSGTATQALIEIFDNYTGLEGMGDDFCLDDLSFVPNVVYSVDAIDDSDISACQNISVDIDVLDNDVVQPNANDAVVSIVTQPSHGTATVLTNKKIRYVFAGGNYSTDQLKYRVTNHGVTDDAWVYINTANPPTVGNITAPGAICAGGALGIPTPTVNPAATGQWEYGSSSTGTFTTFDPNNVPLSMNGKYVRYSASNDCGAGHSNAVQITVTEGPSVGQTPQIQPICAGQSLNLAIPTINNNGSQILDQGWVASPTQNGNYTSFNPNNVSVSYNGWYIRYMVEGSCGFVYSEPARQLIVNVSPDITGMLQAPDAICAGDDLSLVVPTYDGNGTGVWEISQTSNGTFQPFTPTNVPSTYNNWYVHYKVSNDCGSDVSNAVQIHVNDAPTIATPATPQAICAGGSFGLTTPTIQNNGSTITDQGWQIAAQQSGSYSAFNNNNVQYTYNGYWIRYYAVNDCGTTYSPAVQVTVNDIPLVSNITAPAAICAGGAFTLTTPSVTWRHNNQNTCSGGWEIAPTSSGEFTLLTNNNIPFEYNGYYLRYKAVNGCGEAYSGNVVQVTVYSTEDTYEEITACDTYVWHGVTCNHTGDYTAQVQNENGCIITAHLHFTLSDAYTETQNFTSCESFTWPINGQTYYSTGTDTYTIESGNPLVCDSIFTLNVTINNAPEIMGGIAAPTGVICAGNGFSMAAPQYAMHHVDGGDAHWEYATASSGPFTAFDPTTSQLGQGIYYLRFAVVNDCDEAYSNVVSFHVNDAPVANMQLTALQVCEGQALDLPEINVTWNNLDENDRVAEWQMSPTQNGTYAPIDPTMPMQNSHNGYWLRFVASNACGVFIVGPVQISVMAEAEEWLETISACDTYTLPSGEVITESQVVDYESYAPCFHLVHQPIVINYSDHVVDSITTCHEEFVWNGMTFSHSDETQYYSVTLQNEHNCDSVVSLVLDFGNYASFTHNRIACGSYVWEMKPEVTYTESARDSVFVPAVDDTECDTWYYLNLTIGHDTLVDGGQMTECSGFVWHGVPYFDDAIVYDSLQTTVTHCDSIVSYQLTIVAPVETDTAIVSCNAIWWQEHFCEEEGDYQHVFESVQGCDSIVTMHFSLSEQLEYEFDTLACEPFEWYGYQCEHSNMLCMHVFQTPMGCDSLVKMHVFMNETVSSTQFVQACDYYEFEGVIYDQPGITYIYLDTLFTENGCDSLVTRIRLEITDSESLGTISGSPAVFVASNLVNGIYRYDLDVEHLNGDVTWTLTNPDWQIVEVGDTYCRILAATPGEVTLKAIFSVEECGEMERSFDIVAGFFGIDDNALRNVKLYPNPTKDQVTLEAEGIRRVRVINMLGQVLEVLEVGSQDHVMVDLSTFGRSVYLFEIETVNGMAKKRVVLCN